MIRTNSTLVALSVCTAATAGGLPIIGADLDANGYLETEGSFLRRTIANPGDGGSVSFSLAFLTSENHATSQYQDVFRVRLLDATSNAVLAEYGGAVAQPQAYAGVFDTFDFASPTLPGVAIAPAGNSINGRAHVFSTGVIGWNEMTFGIESQSESLVLEFLVADSADANVDSGLAIDHLRLTTAAGAPISVENAGFEAGLRGDGWSIEGEGGVYNFLRNQAFQPAFFADEGGRFALITTEIPAPGAGTLAGLAALAARRRRR